MSTTSDYSRRLDSSTRKLEGIDIRFIWRKQQDGQRLLIPWEGDLAKLSDSHKTRWQPFYVSNPEFLPPDSDPAYTRALMQELHGEFVDEDDLDEPKGDY